jgi:hypothetical protein
MRVFVVYCYPADLDVGEAAEFYDLGVGYCTSNGKTLPGAYSYVTKEVCEAKCKEQSLCLGIGYASIKGVCSLHALDDASLSALGTATGYPTYFAAGKCNKDCNIDKADSAVDPSWGWHCYKEKTQAATTSTTGTTATTSTPTTGTTPVEDTVSTADTGVCSPKTYAGIA